MKMRTRTQENRYGQALGYAWGVKDFSIYTKDLILESAAFAAFWSVYEEEGGKHITIQDAYKFFRDLSAHEQKVYAQSWARRPWSMYEELHPHA